MNAMIEPRSADESALNALTRAKALIEGRDFDAAASLYFKLLDTDLTPALRGEILTNLGAALCLSARGQPDHAALPRLEQARSLLAKALPLRSRVDAPHAWATTRANLAVVHLARYETTNNKDDLLAAHLALDDTETVLHPTAQTGVRDWVRAIRDQLTELRDRRSAPR